MKYTHPGVIAEVPISRDAMQFLCELSDEFKGNLDMSVIIQTVFNYGLNTAKNDRDGEGPGAMYYLMENAPERHRAEILRARSARPARIRIVTSRPSLRKLAA
jgi:hypothetical protein